MEFFSAKKTELKSSIFSLNFALDEQLRRQEQYIDAEAGVGLAGQRQTEEGEGGPRPAGDMLPFIQGNAQMQHDSSICLRFRGLRELNS